MLLINHKEDFHKSEIGLKNERFVFKTEASFCIVTSWSRMTEDACH
jgi:hypothetical protein